jgi:hypothetical protein
VYCDDNALISILCFSKVLTEHFLFFSRLFYEKKKKTGVGKIDLAKKVLELCFLEKVFK